MWRPTPETAINGAAFPRQGDEKSPFRQVDSAGAYGSASGVVREVDARKPNFRLALARDTEGYSHRRMSQAAPLERPRRLR